MLLKPSTIKGERDVD